MNLIERLSARASVADASAPPLSPATRASSLTASLSGVDFLAVAALTGMVALAYGPAIYRDDYGDLALHARVATSANVVDAVRYGYPIFHVLTRGLAAVIGHAFGAGVIVATLARCLVAATAYLLVRRHPASAGTRRATAFVCALLVVALGPLNLLTPGSLYLGYATPNLAHNPTFIVAVPFAIWELLVASRVLASSAPSTRLLLRMALAVTLSSLAKPSYNIAFAPAFGLLASWQWWRGRRDLPQSVRVCLSVVVPFVIVTVAQYALLFGAASEVSRLNSSVIVDPFAVLMAYAKGSVVILVVKLLGSIIVPSLAIVGALEVARNEGEVSRVALAGTAFAVAVLQAILFNEGNAGRALDGNFLWGMHIAAGALLVACAPLAAHSGKLRARKVVMAMVAAASLIGGAAIVRPFLADDAALRTLKATLLGG